MRSNPRRRGKPFKAVTAFANYFTPKKNRELEVYVFRKAGQENDENISGFHTRLRRHRHASLQHLSRTPSKTPTCIPQAFNTSHEILVFGKTQSVRGRSLEAAFQRLKQRSLTLNNAIVNIANSRSSSLARSFALMVSHPTRKDLRDYGFGNTTICIRSSYRECTLPPVWKKADVVPIPKEKPW